jgi:hypothetical protein
MGTLKSPCLQASDFNYTHLVPIAGILQEYSMLQYKRAIFRYRILFLNNTSIQKIIYFYKIIEKTGNQWIIQRCLSFIRKKRVDYLNWKL